jgi:peptidoglycan hydrolase-like protein with peptidoglycan-binding domain
MKKLVVGVTISLVTLFFVPVVHAQSIDELKAEINALLIQIKALETQIQAQLGLSAPSSTSYGRCPTLTRSLQNGMSGSDVTDLQTFLATDASIYPEKIISGYFGTLTESAVQRFQKRNAIVSSGTPDSTGYGSVGPMTRNVISNVCAGNIATTIPTNIYTPGVVCSLNGLTINSGSSAQFYSVQSVPLGSSCASYVQSRQCNNGTLSGSSAYQYPSCTAATSNQSCTINNINVSNGSSRMFYSKSSVTSSESCSSYAQTRTCTNGILSGDMSYIYLSCSIYNPVSCSLDGTTVSHGQSRTFYSRGVATGTATCISYGQSRTCNDGSMSGDGTYSIASCATGACVVDDLILPSGSTTLFYFAKYIPTSEQCVSYSKSRSCSGGSLLGDSAYKYSSCEPVSSDKCALDDSVLENGSSKIFFSEKEAPSGQSCSSYQQTRTCNNGTLSGISSYSYSSCSDTMSCTLAGVTVEHGDSEYFYKSSNVNYGEACSSVELQRSCTNGSLSGSSKYKFAICNVNPPN